MAGQGADDGFLLAILNSTPVIDGVPTDDWADQGGGPRAWLASAGGSGTEAELQHMLDIRQLLQAGGARRAAAGRPSPRRCRG